MEGVSLTIPILVGAALVDSINPCAFGVLIFLLTYLIAGFALLPVLQQFGRAATGVYLAISILLIIFGLLEIKDFFWYGKGPSLGIFPAAARRIEYYTQKVTGKLKTSFFLGVFVALVELPCTGAVYLGVLALVALTGLEFNTALLLVI